MKARLSLFRSILKAPKSAEEAKAAGLAMANSFLFKTAVYGANKNIGRIARALGQARHISIQTAIWIFNAMI